MAKKSMIIRETRRKYPTRVRNRCKYVGGREDICDVLDYAEFASVSLLWKEKFLALLNLPGSRAEDNKNEFS
jgi:hypothetical protein